MREVRLRVPRLAVEDVLDRLLVIVPSGVRERRAGAHVELLMRGDDVPDTDAIAAAVGRWPHTLTEHSVSDDWRQRRLDDYEPDLIAGRLLVRPEWAPPAAGGVIEIVIPEGVAFGGGAHPTTRACLEALLELAPAGSFADLGCGSGVLAVLAAKLGWSPVHAVDVQPQSVEAARGNAGRNCVAVDVRALDLAAEPPPVADGFAANVPAALHATVAAGWREPVPQVGVLSGFGPIEADAVIEAYAARGLVEGRRTERDGWCVAVVSAA